MGKKLLVADDSITIQKVIKLALSSEGYEIVAANGGHEVMQAIQQERPDIVLIDVSLPDMNAYDVKQAVDLTGDGSQARFVLMYSAFERIDDKRADALGFQGRLVKPFDPSNLRKLIADLLRQPPTPVASRSGAREVTTGVMDVTPIPPAATEQDFDLPPLQDEHPIVEEVVLEHVNTSEFSMDVNPALPAGFSAGSIDLPMASQEPDEVPAPPAPLPRDSDIRSLTDSTMQITGLDFGGWSIDESRKMKEPSKLVSLPSQPVDDGGSRFLRDMQIQKPAGAMKSPQRPSLQPVPQVSQAPSVSQEDLEKVLERVVREILPPLAEAIIKRELDRLLSEP